MHFCLLGEDNYQKLASCGVTASDFHSLFDISGPFQVNKSHTLKLADIIMAALSKPSVRDSQYAIDEGDVCPELKAEIGKRIARYKLPSFQHHNQKYFQRVL